MIIYLNLLKIQIPEFVKLQDTITNNGYSRSLWSHPWRYRESIIIVIFILVVSIIIGVLTRGAEIPVIRNPYNIFIGGALVLSILFISLFHRNKPFVLWLSSVPAALSSMILYILVGLVMGLVPPSWLNNYEFFRLSGLSHMKTSWLFLFTYLFVLSALGMVIIRKLFPFKGRSIGFFLNHTGLFVILLAAGLGSGDILRLDVNLLKEESESNIGVSGSGDMYKLPFTLRLLNFSIEEYNPRLVFVDSRTGKVEPSQNKGFPMVEKGLKTRLGSWRIEIEDFIPNAMFIDSSFAKYEEVGSYSAVKVQAISSGRDTIKGWISNGSYLQSPVNLHLDHNTLLALSLPEPKKFVSVIGVARDSAKIDTVTIEVNKPYTIDGWKIYQVGYDQSKGKWSTLSVLEAVNDPWLPLVYAGIFMMMAGTLYLFWIGYRPSKID